MQTATHQASVEEATRPAETDTQQGPAYDDSGHYATKSDLDRLEGRLNTRIDRLEGRLNTRIDRIEGRLNTRIDHLERRMVDGFEEIKGMLQRRSDFRRSVIIAIISAVMGALLTAIFGGLFG